MSTRFNLLTHKTHTTPRKKKDAKRTTRKRLLFRQRTLLDHTKTSEQQQTITHVTSDGRMDGTVRQVRPRDGRLHPTHAVLPAKRRKTRVSLRGKNHGALKSKYSFNLKYHVWKTFLKKTLIIGNTFCASLTDVPIVINSFIHKQIFFRIKRT